VEVPNVIGRPVEEAVALLQEKQLEPNVIEQYHDEAEKGIVFDQSSAGMMKKIHSPIDLLVSKGIEMKTMPDFVGKTYKEVELELNSLGLEPAQIKREDIFYDEPVDTVIRQEPPAGEEYDPRTAEIRLTVSKGRETFEMPNLIGLSESEATAKITVNNLKLAEVLKQPSLKQPAGRVFNQWPFDPNAPVSAGQEIKIYVSTGLPSDAGEVRISVPVKPAVEGGSSDIRIMVNDARYDNFEYASKSITGTETMDVQVVVTPDKNAVIQVFRDNQLIDARTVTYRDYRNPDAPPENPASADGDGGGGIPIGNQESEQ